MRIAILGAGKVGQTLGARFRAAGHDVRYAVRNPADPKYGELGAAARPVADAVRDAELVLLATPWSAAEAALLGAGPLAGKIVVDATNPIGVGGVLTHGRDDSGAEQVARWAPGARVVKAFNSIGREVMANPTFNGRAAVLWLCGDDPDATRAVAGLASAIGFEPLVLGPLARARVLEPAALLWIGATGVLGTREFAWGVLRRG